MQAAQRLASSPEAADIHEALRHLLSNLAGETADLADSADQLQVLFGQLMADPPVRPGDALERAQTLDGLVQRLQGMNAFLADLSARALHDLQAETAQAALNLRLTSQARRFSPQSEDGGEIEVDAGDCDLF